MAAPRKEDIRAAIIESTEKLLESRILSDISLSEIAAEAGVSKGTLYYHFKSKNDILFAITDKYLDKQWDDLIAWTENPEKDTSLHRLVKYVIERNSSFPAVRLQLLCDAATGNDGVREKLIERYSQFEKIIADKISERTDSYPPEFFTWAVLLLSDGMLIQKIIGNSSFDSAAFTSTLTAFIKEIK